MPPIVCFGRGQELCDVAKNFFGVRIGQAVARIFDHFIENAAVP